MNLALLIPVRFGGSGGFIKHLTEVTPRLLSSGKIERITVIAPKSMVDLLADLAVNILTVPDNDYRCGFSEMGKLVASGYYDVALSTIARPVKISSCPVVMMIHNIEPIQTPDYPMPFLWRLRLWMLRRENRQAIRQATRVLAVSNYAKTELCRQFNLSPELIDVVYHGFNPNELAKQRKPDITIPNGFIFCAGSIVPYRGYEDVINSLAYLNAERKIVPYLVIAGSVSYHPTSYERYLKKLAKKLGVGHLIIWAGQLPREEMSWCFQNCSLYVQTSRAEACPNIVLEAMGHGCLTVSCDHPPMPEFFCDAASYYPTGSSSLLAAKISSLLLNCRDENLEWQSRASRRAQFFSWEKTAEQTIEVCERALRQYKLQRT